MDAQLALFDDPLPEIEALRDCAPQWQVFAQFTVLGEPKAQPRQKSVAIRGKSGRPVLDARGMPIIRTYNPGTAENWKSLIAIAAQHLRPQVPFSGAVRVDDVFFFHRPKSLCRRKDPDGPIPYTAKPDRDNSDKAVLDALTTLGFFRDDAIVCDGRIQKFYHAKNGVPHAIIRISILEG